MNFKSHQTYLLVFVLGFVVGASLHYYLNSYNMNYISNKSYKEGYKEGCTVTKKDIIDAFNEADSVFISETSIEFYYR